MKCTLNKPKLIITEIQSQLFRDLYTMELFSICFHAKYKEVLCTCQRSSDLNT